MDPEAKLSEWLKDVYAVKSHTAKALSNYALEAKGHPIARKIAVHAERTRTHLRRIEAELAALGASPSALGGAVARILGMGQAAASRFLGDRILTNGAGALALEELEIATLEAVAVAARLAGKPRCAKACEAMAREDQRFLGVFGKAFPALTRRYLLG